MLWVPPAVDRGRRGFGRAGAQDRHRDSGKGRNSRKKDLLHAQE
jgi:hypothetical protein